MAVLYSNNASSALSASITNSATSFSVTAGHGAKFPAITNSDYFYATLVSTGGAIEIVKVTARSTDTFTVVRGQDGTTGTAFTAGDKVELRITKAMLDDYKGERLALTGGTMSGAISFSNVTGNKLAFYNTGTDKYGIDVQSSELRIFSGAQGDATGGITFGKHDGTTFTESFRILNSGGLRDKSGMTAWGTTTPGTGAGNYHIGVGSSTSNSGGAITFGARDASNGTTAQAGIYITSDGTYGTRMYLATTDSYATGARNALSISEGGVVNFIRARPTYAGNTILDAANYSSYAVPTTSTAYTSGFWMFNNMGNNHSTYTDANSVPGFGPYYVQSGTNGPGTGGAQPQYYGLTLGLGADYTSSQYASQFFWPRTPLGGSPYVSVRFKENGSWGSWSKIYAGYADSSGSVTLGSGSITTNVWAGGGGYPGYSYTGGNSRFGFSSTSGVIDVYADGNFYATDSSHLVLHAGNYTNYEYTRLSSVASNPNGSHPGYGIRPFYSWNTGQAYNDSAGYSNGITIGSHPSDQAYGFQIVQNMWDDRLYFRRYNGGWQSWRTVVDTATIGDYTAGGANSLQGYQWMSSGKSVRANEFYADGWLRNYNSNTGLYNEATANHFYSDGNYWNVGYNGTTGIRLRQNHAGPILGYYYAETTGNSGLLNNYGNWAVHVYPNNGGGNLENGTWSANGGTITSSGNSSWVRAHWNFYGIGSIGYGNTYNVSSISRVSTGVYTINLSISLTNAACVLSSGGRYSSSTSYLPVQGPIGFMASPSSVSQYCGSDTTALRDTYDVYGAVLYN